MKDVVFLLVGTLAWTGWIATFVGWLVLWIKPGKIPVAQHCFTATAVVSTLTLMIMSI